MSYLVLHGAQDGDVRSLLCARQYDRLRFTDDRYHFKSVVYIAGARPRAPGFSGLAIREWLGVALARRSQGQGYAAEALTALLDCLF